jgi:PAS domain-containing protein
MATHSFEHLFDLASGGIDIKVFLDHTSDAVLVLDDTWSYVYVNHAAEVLLRRRCDQLLGRHHLEEFPSLRGTPAETELASVFELLRPARYEQFIPQLYAWHRVLAMPTQGRVVLFCRDITDRVRALREDAVREGLRAIFEHLPAAVTLTRGPEHRIDLQNENSRQIVRGENMEGKLVRNALPEAAEQGFIELLDRVYATGESFTGKELPLTLERGIANTPEQRFFDLTYQPIFETDGKVAGILHLGHDVTERLRERQQLAQMAAERYAILRQLDEGVILTDPKGQIQFVNETARELHGVAVLDVEVDQYTATYQLQTVEGTPYPPTELPLARAVLNGEQVRGARWRILRPDGSIVLVEGNARPILGEEGLRLGCVLTLHAVC